ncbi:non-canonical purine NTP pyrophosphatase [Candidatus Parcubacteria bacterium]|nr:non-canonical purine NTP pyrophosphatase [Candidatus Parcubacteria bacterium]
MRRPIPITLSTRNPSKTEQIKAIFAGSNCVIRTLAEARIKGEAVEDGDTLYTNALKKAEFARGKKWWSIFALWKEDWSISDDTGIFITALKGEPGHRAARWAGEDAETEEITVYTLKRLEGITDRSAVFRTTVVLMSPKGKPYSFTGEVRGTILEAPRVPAHPKMPYSPIFLPDGETQVWAEMTVEYENSISHRGKAFRKARQFLEYLHR